MKILVPVDFSDLSKVAVRYACGLAEQLNAELILIHVAYISTSSTRASLMLHKIVDRMLENAKSDMQVMMNELTQFNVGNLKITTKILNGSPMHDMIESFAVKNKVDFIIMGTKGASGIKKVIMGSNAASIIASTSIPVIAVPELAQYKGVAQMLYATDLLDIDHELNKVIDYAKLFHSYLQLLHIVPIGSKEIKKAETIKNDLTGRYEHSLINVEVVESDDIKNTIDRYVNHLKADILVMFTHKPGFFEKIFGRSITREMAFHTYVPLMALKKI